ncbi:MAG: hypothetical protein J3R72DRAFT_530129 [Linnemannia gamsii]|nr:MAG: hypothetical protein J3R72DRAFT_530129 [Linnemannia gamsii]
MQLMLAPSLLPRQLGVVALIVATLCIQSVSAQTPVSVGSMAYTTVDEKTLYVHGGIAIAVPPGDNKVMPQFYSLDLTKSGWDTSSPPWTELIYPSNLASSPPHSHSMTVSPDGKTLTTWFPYPDAFLVANYSITSNSWTKVPFATNLTEIVRATTDPTTGTIYLPAGIPNNTIKYSFATGRSILESIPTTVNIPNSFYSFVWCQTRKSFILFTGETNISPFFEYTPSTSQWKVLPTTGFVPPFRSESCMQSAYNGTKIILFGGRNGRTVEKGSSVGNLYILDVTSMTWTEGPSADARSLMACSVSGDNFLVWGGYKLASKASAVPTTPLIYDMKIDQWTTKYIRHSSGEGGDTGGREYKINGAAIGGGIAGGIAVIAAISFFIIRRRQSRRDPDSISISDISDINNKYSETTLRQDQVFPSEENTRDGSVFGKDMISKTNQQSDKLINPQHVSHMHSQVTLDYLSPQPKPPSPYGKTFYPLPILLPHPPLTTPPRTQPADPQYHHRYHQQQHQYQPYSTQDHSACQYGNPQYHNPPAFTETRSLPSNTRGPQGTAEPNSTGASNQELLEQINSLQAEWIRRQATHNA